MIMRNFLSLALLFLTMPAAAAPNRFSDTVVEGALSVGSSSQANAKAALEVTSTTKGFLPPRMTTLERDSIATPPAGLLVYNATTGKVNVYNGSTWVNAGAATAADLASTPSGNLAATDVQAALNELQTDIDTRATSSDLTTHTGSTAAHSATSANTASRIVARDGSGNFSATTITANLIGNVTGTASGNAAASHTHGDSDILSLMPSKLAAPVDVTKGGTGADLTGGSGVLIRTSGVAADPFGVGTVPWNYVGTSNANKTMITNGSGGLSTSSFGVPTTSNTANSVVARDGSGNISGETITATLFSGPGGDITQLNGSNISTGTVAPARGGTGQDFSAANGFVKFTAGVASVTSVSGGGGFDMTNQFTDGDAESASTANWTSSLTGGATFQTTDGSVLGTKFSGTYSYYFDAAQNGNYIQRCIAVPDEIKGENSLLYVAYKGADSNLTLSVTDGTNPLATAVTLSASSGTKFARVPISFVGPSSGNVCMRLAATANAAAVSFEAYLGRNFLLGTNQNVVTKVMSDKTFTLGAFGTTTVNSFQYWRTGDRLNVRGYFVSGTPAASVPYIQLPAGLTIDSTKISATAHTQDFGKWQVITNGGTTLVYEASAQAMGVVTVDTAALDRVKLAVYTGSGTFAYLNNTSLIGSGQGLEVTIRDLPIVGWDAPETTYTAPELGWYVDANIAGANISLGTSAQASYVTPNNASLTLTRNAGSTGAVGISCSSTNDNSAMATTCSAGNEEPGVTFEIPKAGVYEACFAVTSYRSTSANGYASHGFQVIETANGSQTIVQEGKDRTNINIVAGTSNSELIIPNKVCGLFTFASSGRKTLRLMYEQAVAGTVSSSLILADAATAEGQRDIHVTVRPWLRNETVAIKGPRSTVRLSTGNGHGATNNKIRRYSTVVENKGTAITYADSATLGASLTINEDGVYAISVQDYSSAGGYQIGVSKNSTQLTTTLSNITDADILTHCSPTVANNICNTGTTVVLSAGDVIRPHGSGAPNTSDTNSRFTITKVSD
jgi:hypothetical protein